MNLPSPLPAGYACAFSGVPSSIDWSAVQRRFPERPLEGLSNERQAEHAAVDAALHQLGLSGAVTHDPHGGPLLPNRGLSISHAQDGNGVTWAAVAVGPTPLGLDLEIRRPQLERMASRIFSEAERALVGTGEDADWRRCAIWNVKEAAWKALGPDLDYLGGIEVLDLMPAADYERGGQIPVRILHTTHSFYIAQVGSEFGMALGPFH